MHLSRALILVTTTRISLICRTVSVCMLLLCLCVLQTDTQAMEHTAHTHGAAHLNLAIEDNQITLELSSPLANFLSFEHRAVSDEQKKEAHDLLLRIENTELFQFPDAAECHRETFDVATDVLSPSASPLKNTSSEHSDITIRETLSCAHPEKLWHCRTSLFQYAKHLKNVHVQMVTPRGQHSGTFTTDVVTLSS